MYILKDSEETISLALWNHENLTKEPNSLK